MSRIFVVAALMLVSGASYLSAQTADIKKETNKLSDVKKSIKQKQLEKDRLVLQEKVFKRELKALNDALEANQKNLAKLSLESKQAQQNLEKASSEYSTALNKRGVLEQSIIDELKFYHKMAFESFYEKSPFEYKIIQETLKRKKELFEYEKNLADLSSGDMKKWEASKNRLAALRKKENSLAAQRKKLLKEKQVILASTAGRRAVAEMEIKTLNESAKELQTLVNKLTRESREREKAKTPQVVVVKSKSQPRKINNLPWPVSGKVIAKFGKTKHKDLDTYVISNGIKIQAADFAPVKSVASGTVVFCGNFRSYGNVVIVDHKSFFSVYGGLAKILTREDDKVNKGTFIASLGKGDAGVLYFEIRQDNAAHDPILWLEGNK